MSKKKSAFAKLLASTFTEEEVAYLEQQPHFDMAIAAVSCFTEFERVCSIGQRMLSKRERAELQFTA